MRLRLPRWLRREPAPQGRHVRRPAPVTAPSAAAALVIGAAEPYLVAPTPAEPPAPEPPAAERLVDPAAATPGAEAAVADVPLAELPPPGPDPVTAGDQNALPITSGDAEATTEPADLASAPGFAATPPPTAPAAPDAPVTTGDGVPGAAAAAEATVALGFADGGVLELAPDDPRLAGFQDAAAAVLARPEA